MKKFKIVIRDDDLCSFSNIEMHQSAINFYKSMGCAVIVGLVPNSVEIVDHIGDRLYLSQQTKFSPIYNNPELIKYVRTLSEIGCEIYAHGYTHKYINDNIASNYGEFSQINFEDASKKYLDIVRVFNIAGIGMPSGFIPPSNSISYSGLAACANFFNNISYLLPLNYRFKSSKLLLDAIIKKIHRTNSTRCYSSKYQHLRIEPYITYSRKSDNYDEVISYLELCKKNSVRAVIATHYWEIADIEYKNRFRNLLENYVL